MTGVGETPKEPRRRGRRPLREAANSSVINPVLSNREEAEAFSDFADGAIRPAQILHRREPVAPLASDSEPSSNTLSPKTPQRPHTMPKGEKATYQNSTCSTHEASQTRKHRTKTAQAQHVKAPPTPTRNGIATTIPQSNSFTPGSSSATPSKAYAGPTFHASPAASSLPLPKLFSKSVPNVDKTTSLKSMLGQDSLETTSESEGSPFQETATPSKVREKSPLDIFFQADQKEKAKRSLGITSERVPREPNNFPNRLKILDYPPASARPRNHIRHHTDSSAAGVFPLEMDAATPESSRQQQNTIKANHMNLSGKKKEPMYVIRAATDEERMEEQRQVQSIALKQLLQLPREQCSDPPTHRSKYQSTNLASPTPHPRPENRSSLRLSGAPPQLPKVLDTPQDQRRAALLALAEKQVASSDGELAHRPPTLGIHKEMVIPRSTDSIPMPHMPSAPTSSKLDGKDKVCGISDSYGSLNNSFESAFSPISPISPGNGVGHSSHITGSDKPSVKSMEEDLRRILKLDAFRGDDIASIRSQYVAN